jgi:hypothetical protein
MKRTSALIVVVLVCISAGEVLLAGVDAHTWNNARKKFFKGADNLDELPALIDELAELNDERAVELLCNKTLFHETFEIRDLTFNALAATTDPNAVKYLAEKVRRDSKNRLIYTMLMQYMSGAEVVKAIEEALQDKRWEVVSAGIEAARKSADKSLLPALKKIMEGNNPRLAYEAALACEACGGEVPGDLKPAPTDSIFPARIFSKKCLVLFDESDEMATSMALPAHAMGELLGALEAQRPKDYKELLAEEKEGKSSEKYETYCVRTRQFYCANMMTRALATLGKDAEANVMRYSTGAALWDTKKFRKLDDKDLESLRKYVGDIMTQPARDLYDALRWAMKLEDVDTVYIVTCGLPAGARVENTDEIISWLRQANYERQIRINTAVVLSRYFGGKPSDEEKLEFEKSSGPVLDFYRSIAGQNGGECRYVMDAGKNPLAAAVRAKEEPKKEDPSKEPKKEEPKKEEPAKEGPAKEEAKKEEPQKEEPKGDEPKKEEPKKRPKDDRWLPGGR